ncbi:MAG TPA: T9SS type A sorting domain-containing protein [Bacteroidia bacterium]|jgi:hypothetical protein|nr:T9SS type A sorting domain-containing protein [Bacteroidia bacterium]
MKKNLYAFILFFFLQLSFAGAQGFWTPIANLPVDTSGGGMLLLSDGTVIAKTFTESSGALNGYGDIWDRLIPDSTGSYANGTWSTIAHMNNSRLYFSSQMLKDGRLYVAGGEYGTGLNKGETYNPVTDTWTPVTVPAGDTLYDANSAMLPDGRVLQAVVVSSVWNANIFFDPLTNTYAPAPSSHGNPDEAAFVKLPDNSILFIQNPIVTPNYRSERYIPASNQWVQDALLSDTLWLHTEIGTGMLLPNGKVIFFGASGHTAYYTPSGTIAPGSWTSGPDLPSGLGTADAAAAMLPNGHVLLVASPKPTTDTTVFLNPAYFLEFDYVSNSFMMLAAPGGGSSLPATCFMFNLLNLPDGTVILSSMGNNQYYLYTSSGSPLPMAKPVISHLLESNCHFTLTGTGFNGICEGSSYGDDWQTATNYPVIRFTNAGKVYYARTFNWNHTGVQTGTLSDTVQFTIPLNMPGGTYTVQVTANGVASDPLSWTYVPCVAGIAEQKEEAPVLHVFPNPAGASTQLTFASDKEEKYSLRILDLFGRELHKQGGEAQRGQNSIVLETRGMPQGIYLIVMQQGCFVMQTRLVVE